MMSAFRIIRHTGLSRCTGARVQDFKCFHHDVEAKLEDSCREAVLYYHWPYCARRCSYCNFNKYINRSVNHERMTECLIQETKTLLELSAVKRIKSIFFGGGTPSLALPDTIGKVIETVKESVIFDERSEVTLEANPTHLETSRLRGFHDAGVNRLSIGVQALSDDDLKLLGRDHSVQDSMRCLSEAKDIYDGNISVDLIFGRPKQTLELWMKELKQILEMDMNHVSLYQLTVERGTLLHKWVESGKVTLPDNDTMADMYIMAVETMSSAGLNRYEVSNFAKMGLESKHNQAYWQGVQYIGVGPGAHGRFVPVNKNGIFNFDSPREARIQTLEPDNWMFEVEKNGHATRKITPLSVKDRLEEYLCSGLRTKDGILRSRWENVSQSQNLSSVYSELTTCEKCKELVLDGLILVDERRMKATSDGIMILDNLLPHLLHELGKTCHEEGIT